MGTRGYIVVRFRKRYYVTFNSSDSYPSYLGNIMASRVPKDPAEFAKWLSGMIEMYEKEEEKFEDFSSVTANRGQVVKTVEFDSGNPRQALDLVPLFIRPQSLENSSTFWPPVNTLFIEWIYITDLDRLIFSVGSRKFRDSHCTNLVQFYDHFRLDDIPEGWADELDPASGRAGETGLNGMFVDYPKPEPAQNLLDLYEHSHPAIFQASLPASTSVDEFISTELLQDFTQRPSDSKYRYFLYLNEWGPNDPQFKQLAFGLLCLSSSPDIVIDHGELEDPLFQCAYPVASEFWFDGIYIIFETHLDHPDNLKAAVAKAIRAKETSSEERFTALVFSIRHVVVVEVDSDGAVKHTEPILVVGELGEYCAFDDSRNFGFRTIIAVLSHGRAQLAIENEPKASSISPANLPNELLLRILELTDIKARDVLRNSSRLLRRLADSRRRIGPYTLNGLGPQNTIVATVEGSGELARLVLTEYVAPDRWPRHEAEPLKVRHIVKFSHQGARVRGLPFYYLVDHLKLKENECQAEDSEDLLKLRFLG